MNEIKAAQLWIRTAFGLALGCVAVVGGACGGGDGPPGDPPPDSGERCGGIIGLVCPAGEYCDHEAGSCGAGDVLGTCRALPTMCTKECTTVCGCDGVSYCNPCTAHLAGVDDAADTTCNDPPPTAP